MFRDRGISLTVFFIILVLDQATKHAARLYLSLGEPVEMISGLFSLTLVYNPGVAFGLFSDFSDATRQLSLVVVSVLALGAVLYFFHVEAREDRFCRYALVGILAGAVGNIIDRIRFDRVVDFLDFYIGQYHWPAFNVADSAISVGVCLLLCRWLFAGRKS